MICLYNLQSFIGKCPWKPWKHIFSIAQYGGRELFIVIGKCLWFRLLIPIAQPWALTKKMYETLQLHGTKLPTVWTEVLLDFWTISNTRFLYKKRKHCWNRYREFIPLYPAFHSLCGLLYIFWISFLKWNRHMKINNVNGFIHQCHLNIPCFQKNGFQLPTLGHHFFFGLVQKGLTMLGFGWCRFASDGWGWHGCVSWSHWQNTSLGFGYLEDHSRTCKYS